MSEKHILKRFDQELGELNDVIAAMATLATTHLAQALQALLDQDTELAAMVIAGDDKVDALEVEINERVVRILALRSPVADDLRKTVTALKVASNLERIADYAANTAKRTLAVSEAAPLPPVRVLSRMGALAIDLVRTVMTAYLDRDEAAAMTVWERDQDIDELNSSLFRELLTYMMEDPRNIAICSHLMFIAKNLERAGDHATNIAEMTYFLITGKPLISERPKRDTSSSMFC